MSTATLSAILTAAALLSVGRQESQPRPALSSETTYEEFMKLPVQQRTGRFAAISPENQALIMRTHAEQWLEKNRSRLSAAQIELVQKAVEFVTPALYRTPNDPGIVKTSKALEAELRCRVRRSDVQEAFGPSRSPVPPASWLDDAWAWIESCILG